MKRFEIDFDCLTPYQKKIQLQILEKRRLKGECVCFVKNKECPKIESCCGKFKKNCKVVKNCVCSEKKTLSTSWIKTHMPELPVESCEVRNNNCCKEDPIPIINPKVFATSWIKTHPAKNCPPVKICNNQSNKENRPPKNRCCCQKYPEDPCRYKNKSSLQQKK